MEEMVGVRGEGVCVCVHTCMCACACVCVCTKCTSAADEACYWPKYVHPVHWVTV